MGGKLSGTNDVAKAMDYMLKRWTVFAIDTLRGSILDDGRICLTNNAAEQVMAVHRLRPGRPARRGHVQPDRQRQDK